MPDDSQSVYENPGAAYNRLRRLQEQNRSNLPAFVAQRPTSTFSLHDEPLPIEAHDRVLVVVYPQDPFVGEPEVRTMSKHDIQPELVNSRVRIQDDRGNLAKPDSDGNYLYWPGTPQFDQVNAFYYATFTLRMFERFAQRALPWSFPAPRITVDPHFGDQANAFYSEQDRMLGFHTFRLNGDLVSTAWSADIVSHETAHAVLDGVRDLYNESFGLGASAFHESFGDIAAMLVALHDDSLVRRLLDWTKGDLRLDNFVASVAEQLTTALKEGTAGYLRGHTVYLRNAINGLKQLPFDALTFVPPDPEIELGLQSHNYSRLFTGAFYDILVGIFDLMNTSLPSHIAIYGARNTAARLLMSAVELGPVGEFDFSDMARAFLAADHLLYDGRHHDVMFKVFDERKLLDPDDGAKYVASLKKVPDVTLPNAMNSAMASALFLEQDILPVLPDLATKGELIPMAAYRNAAGNAYVTYFSTQRITLTGSQYRDFEGSQIDLFGGLTLAFNQHNKLCSVMHRPVNDEDIRQIRILTAKLIEAGLVVNSDGSLASASFIRPDKPEGLVIPKSRDEKPKTQLVKFPIIYDSIPPRVPDFVDYLRKMRGKPHKK